MALNLNIVFRDFRVLAFLIRLRIALLPLDTDLESLSLRILLQQPTRGSEPSQPTSPARPRPYLKFSTKK